MFKKNSENKLIDNLTDIFTNRVLTIEKIDKNNKKEYYEVLFTVTGAISLFINWLMKDREMKPSELSNILNDIILKLDWYVLEMLSIKLERAEQKMAG